MLKAKTRKEDILKAAARLFRKTGYKATSMRDIAREVGIEAPSLYNHIKSKEELLSNMLLELANEFVSGMKDILAKQLNPTETLKLLIDLHIDITVAKTNQISLLTDEWRHLNQDSKEEYLRLRNLYEEDFVKVLHYGMNQGLFKKIEVSVTLFSILSTLRSFYAWYTVQESKNLEEIKDQFHSILLNGLVI